MSNASYVYWNTDTCRWEDCTLYDDASPSYTWAKNIHNGKLWRKYGPFNAWNLVHGREMGPQVPGKLIQGWLFSD